MDFSKLKTSRLVHLCFAITFFTSGVIVNLIQCLFYLTLWNFNKTLYRKINWYFCFVIYGQMVFLGDWWAGSRVKFYIDRKEFDKYYGKEHAYCVMNHSNEIDWLVGWMICNRIHMLGNCKAYAKKVIQYIPVLGWGWKCSEFVFLERSFDKDRETIDKQVTALADHPDPMWLLLFPEGTRFTPNKHKISAEFAKKKNLPELKYHLQPRTKGFTASLPSMKGKVPAVYDIELCFKPDAPYKPTITSLLNGFPVVAHIYMRRIPMEDVPETEPEQEEFLREMFLRKDKLRDSFDKTGDFFATSGLPRVEPFEIDRRVNSVFVMVFWSVVIMLPMIYYLVTLLFSGNFLYFSLGIAIISAFYLLLNKTIGMSEIKKGSSYGTDTSSLSEKKDE